MKKEDVIFERKEFLNLPGHNSMANIITQIVKHNYNDDDELYRNISIILDFADCTRVVSMDLEYDSDYARENTLHKIDTIVDVLGDFREALVRELKYQKRLEKKRAKRKAEKKEKEKGDED